MSPFCDTMWFFAIPLERDVSRAHWGKGVVTVRNFKSEKKVCGTG